MTKTGTQSVALKSCSTGWEKLKGNAPTLAAHVSSNRNDLYISIALERWTSVIRIESSPRPWYFLELVYVSVLRLGIWLEEVYCQPYLTVERLPKPQAYFHKEAWKHLLIYHLHINLSKKFFFQSLTRGIFQVPSVETGFFT